MRMRKSTSSTVVPHRKTPKLDTSFACPFCNHAGSVEYSIDRKLRIAEATCGVCKASYVTASHALTEPIDIYSEWIDECDHTNDDPMDCTYPYRSAPTTMVIVSDFSAEINLIDQPYVKSLPCWLDV